MPAHRTDNVPTANPTVTRDPVSGMTVDPATAKHQLVAKGQTYYFCSAACKAKFEADPARYLAPSQSPAPEVAEGAIWTCPMHPEIRQDSAGSCPICGMDLVTQGGAGGSDSVATELGDLLRPVNQAVETRPEI